MQINRLFVTAALGLVGTSAALAQSTGLEEITVTAQRRAEAAQNVGIALSVLPGAELLNHNLTTLNELQHSTPNLQIEPAFGGGQPQFRIRGVGFQDYATNNAPTVGIYINEVAYPVPVMTQGLIYDMDRIEVLRGPQGTLYGRNTTGGAINFITRKPTEDFSAGATFEYGSYGLFHGEGYMSGTLAPNITSRVSIGADEGGAWQHNRDTGQSLGDADIFGARDLISIDFSAKANLLLDFHGGYDKSENTGLYLFTPLSTNLLTQGGRAVYVPADLNHSVTGWDLPADLARDAGLPANAKPGRNNSAWGVSANASWDLGPVKLTNIASYDILMRKEYDDWDATSFSDADVFFGSHVNVWSDELRLSGDNGPLQWVAGLYYSKQHLEERYYSDFVDLYGTYGRVIYGQDVESIAGFAQAEYAFTQQWKMTAGLRFENEDRNLQGFGSAFGGATALPPTNVATSMSPVTGKLQLDYKPEEAMLIYASASQGAKSGGFTTYNTGDSSAIQAFKPEYLWAYELGAKTDVLPNLQINGDGFFYDYRDQQVLSAVYGPNGPVGRFTNAPKSQIWGLELEARWQVMDRFNLSQYASYTQGKYIEFYDLSLAASQAAHQAVYVDKSGQPIPFPSTTYGGAASYWFPLSSYEVEVETNYSFISRGVTWLGPLYTVAPYWLTNLNLTLRPEAGKWSGTFFIRNLFDTTYDLTRNFYTSANIAQPGRPRTFGVRVSYDF